MRIAYVMLLVAALTTIQSHGSPADQLNVEQGVELAGNLCLKIDDIYAFVFRGCVEGQKLALLKLAHGSPSTKGRLITEICEHFPDQFSKQNCLGAGLQLVEDDQASINAKSCPPIAQFIFQNDQAIEHNKCLMQVLLKP